jgi:hypothetical protein
VTITTGTVPLAVLLRPRLAVAQVQPQAHGLGLAQATSVAPVSTMKLTA